MPLLIILSDAESPLLLETFLGGANISEYSIIADTTEAYNG